MPDTDLPKLIQNHLHSAILDVSNRINDYVVHPGIDFTRRYKLPPEQLFSFLIFQGSSSTRNELADAFDSNANHPSLPALVQQRAKLKTEGIAQVFYQFTHSLEAMQPKKKYRFIAVDGSTFSFLSNKKYATDEYHTDQGNPEKGCYSVHAVATYDLDTLTYTDCIIQPIKQKDEFGALASLIDRHSIDEKQTMVIIGDRGFCSYNNFAHAINRGQFFLFRSKDIHSKGMLQNFPLPSSDCFDIDTKVIVIRKQSKKLQLPEGNIRYIGQETTFDFVEYGSSDYYELPLRIVRFELSPGHFESIVTNLPRKEFSPEDLKALYNRRWGIETSFRLLKYTIGLLKFHASKPEFVKQEIWARLIAYNFTTAIVNSATVQNSQNNKYIYHINYSCAVHYCRQYFRSALRGLSIDVIALLLRELVPIRPNRSFPRSQTAHFRRPAYFTYRAS